jgi:hypothetical protein
MNDDNILRIALQKFQTFFDGFENNVKRSRSRRFPARLEDRSRVELCDVISSFSEVDDGVSVCVTVFNDGRHVVDVVAKGGLEAVGRVRHGGYPFSDAVLKLTFRTFNILKHNEVEAKTIPLSFSNNGLCSHLKTLLDELWLIYG